MSDGIVTIGEMRDIAAKLVDLREVRNLSASSPARETDSVGRLVLRGVDTCFCHGCGDVVVRGSNAHGGESYCDGCEAAPADAE
jgi:hypothetical protein